MIAWVDIETTGLDAQHDMILEIGSIVTDNNMVEIGSFNRIIHSTPEVRDMASLFVKDMHDKSGLWQKCYESSVALVDAENDLIDFWSKCGVNEFSKPPLGGSSVHFDRAFMAAWTPRALSKLGYRNLDVSSIKEVVKRVVPDHVYVSGVADEDKPHRTIADLENSIAELKYYIQTFFTNGVTNG